MALPSFIIILIVAKCFQRFKNSSLVQGCMSGLRPAVVGLIATALLSVGQTVFFPEGLAFGATFYVSLGVFLLSAVLAFRKLHPIWIIVISAAIGVAVGYGLGL